MCDKCESGRKEATIYVEGVFDWFKDRDPITMPDGLTEVVVTSAEMASRAAEAKEVSVEATLTVGVMVIETCRVAFFDGYRTAQLEREAPNGEGELATVFTVPVQLPASS